jgi:hypothetical protein
MSVTPWSSAIPGSSARSALRHPSPHPSIRPSCMWHPASKRRRLPSFDRARSLPTPLAMKAVKDSLDAMRATPLGQRPPTTGQPPASASERRVWLRNARCGRVVGVSYPALLRQALEAQGLPPHKVDEAVQEATDEAAAIEKMQAVLRCPRCDGKVSRRRDSRQAGTRPLLSTEWYNYRCTACPFMVDIAEGGHDA